MTKLKVECNFNRKKGKTGNTMYNNFLSQVSVSAEEPMNGEHLHRALNRQDVEMMEKILESG